MNGLNVADDSRTAPYMIDWSLGRSRRPKRRAGRHCSVPKTRPKVNPTTTAYAPSLGVVRVMATQSWKPRSSTHDASSSSSSA
eukprot:689751-Prymnesium_polylepis.1